MLLDVKHRRSEADFISDRRLVFRNRKFGRQNENVDISLNHCECEGESLKCQESQKVPRQAVCIRDFNWISREVVSTYPRIVGVKPTLSRGQNDRCLIGITAIPYRANVENSQTCLTGWYIFSTVIGENVSLRGCILNGLH
jgi:hypothetical protein